MEIRVGKFTICSDQWSYWITEEYIPKKPDGTLGKPTQRKVAGYARSIDTLIQQFVEHKHRASEAATVEQLIREMKQVIDDAILLKKTAVANDLKLMRKTGKQIKEINKDG